MSTHPTTVAATPVVVQQTHWQPRSITKDEKRCCCTCTRATVCIWIAMMAIGGIALIGVGIKQLMIQSVRYSKVHEYNDDVEATAKDYPSKSSKVALGVSNISVQQPVTGTPVYAEASFHKVTTVDSAFDVDKYTSYVLTAILPTWTGNLPAKMTINTDASDVAVSTESVTRHIAPTKQVSTVVQCNAHACTEDCDRDHMECTQESMQRYCTFAFGDDAVFHGDEECNGGDDCGTCTYTGHLETACVVMEQDMKLGFDHHLDSCFYPFKADSQIYTAHTANHSAYPVKVVFRSASDPFISMQRITEGTMSFGHPTKVGAGGTLLIFIGLALIIAPCCGMCCYRCFCYEPRTARRHAEDGEEKQEVTFVQTQPTYPVGAPVGPPVHTASAQPPAQPMVNANPIHAYPSAEYHKGEQAPYGMVPEDEGRLFGARSSSSSSMRSQVDDTQVIIEVPIKN